MVYAFWENWELYHKCIFDGVNKTIYVTLDVTDLHIKEDVYSDWKEWVAMEDNAKYEPAIRTIGGDSVGGGKYAGDIYFLINGWKLQIDLSQTKVVGVLVSDDYPTAYYTFAGAAQYPAEVSQLVQTVSVPVVVEVPVGVSPAEIAAAVWSAPMANHNITGTFGNFIQKKLLTIAKYIGLK